MSCTHVLCGPGGGASGYAPPSPLDQASGSSCSIFHLRPDLMWVAAASRQPGSGRVLGRLQPTHGAAVLAFTQQSLQRSGPRATDRWPQVGLREPWPGKGLCSALFLGPFLLCPGPEDTSECWMSHTGGRACWSSPACVWGGGHTQGGVWTVGLAAFLPHFLESRPSPSSAIVHLPGLGTLGSRLSSL